VSAPAAGDTIDGFRVERPLGRGGFGEVFLARDVRLGRRVALKVLRRERFGSADEVERFLEEARTTARFSHPHIVAIHAVGEWEGRPYVALEYLEGQSLRERLLEGRPGVREAVRVALAIADALAEAHRRGVLHRDLKPGNVMIPRDGRVRVVDFGEARPVDEARAEGRGTPAYMPPERWRRDPEGPAADVWSLGIVLYELLSGRRPYQGMPPTAMALHIGGDDPAPTLPDDGLLPPELGELVARCLDKDPTARPTASELVETLRGLLATAPGAEPAAPSATVQPYRGLLPFAERHADRFFGREREIDAFGERLRHTPVLPLIGPSGAGKSSFLRAGVLPRLREQGPWIVLRIRPGQRPFASLAMALVRAGGDSWTGGMSESSEVAEREARAGERRRRETLARELREVPGRLWVTLHELADEHDARVLLLVDQLEELYTHTRDEEDQERFVRALCAATDDPASPVRVVAALRDDFVVPFAAGPGARSALGQVFVLRAPGPSALREAVVRPLEAVGYRLEDEGQADQMVADLAGAPGCLPAMQAACEQLWERRDAEQRTIPARALEDIGGVSGALARHADGALAGLTPEQLAVARALLLRLVTPERTRRIATRGDLLEGIEGGEWVLDALVRGRVVHAGRGERGDDAASTVELVHESLIAGWDRLRRWLDEAREELAYLEDVSQAADVWQRRGRRDEELWSGDALEEAWERIQGLASPAPGAVVQFLSRGRERASEQRRRTRRRTATQAGILISVALISAVSAVFIFGRMRASLAASTLCEPEEEPLAGIWDAEVRGAARDRFATSERPHAAATFDRLAGVLDGYASSWGEMRHDACLATYARGEQSSELYDLRLRCLDRRASELGALTTALSAPLEAPVVDETLEAAYRLTPLSACADAEALAEAVPPPEDPRIREQVDGLQGELDAAVTHLHLGDYEAALDGIRGVVEAADGVDHPPFQAEARHWLGRALARSGDPRDGEAELVLAIEMAAAARDDRLVAESWVALVDVVGNEQGRYRDALLMGQLGRAQVQRAGAGPYLRVRFLGVLGQVQAEMDHHDEARASFEMAYRILEEQLGTDHPDLAVTLEGLGQLAISRADYEEAESLFLRALEIRRRTLGESHPEVAVPMKGLGKARFRQGRYDEARAAYDEALALLREGLGPDHPDVGAALGRLGPIQRSLGEYEAAEATYLEALAIVESAPVANPSELSALLNNLGTLHAYQREDDEARGYYLRALEIVESVYGSDHSRTARVLGNIGTTYARQERHDRALDYYERALTIRERAFGPDHYDVAQTHMYLGASYVNMGRFAEAILEYERCVPVIEATVGPDHQLTLYALNGYGEALVGAGRMDEAIGVLERVLAQRLTRDEDPVETGTTRFALARALHALDRDPGRVDTLLADARGAFVDGGEGAALLLADMDRWVRANRR